MKLINNFKRNLKLAFNGFFRGMAAADATIQGTTSNGGDTETVQHIRGGGGVLADMLEEKQTQAVVEMRDKYYRVLKEADKYIPHITMSEEEIINENGEKEIVPSFDISGGVTKKTAADFIKHPPVMEEEGTTLRTIQDNKHFASKKSILGEGEEAGSDYFGNGLYDYQTTLTIERDGFVPRFELEKFVTRVVSRNVNGKNRAIVDLYTPTIASQFGKIDAILIANINQIKEANNLRSDITDFKTIEWYSDKAWNSDDVCLFKYDDVHFKGVNVFDGNFVLSFDCNIVNDGTYIAEKYKTKELDEKYASEAPKRDNIDIFTLQRHLNKEKGDKKDIDLGNLKNTPFSLT